MPTTFLCSKCQVIINLEHDEQFAKCGSCQALCQVPTGIEPGVVVDDYLIKKLLGKGGKGNVYLAHELTLKRDVALKVLGQNLQDDQSEKESLLKEARLVASLNHPNIVHAHKFGEYRGILYFVMELVDGQTLHSIIKERGVIEENDIYPIALDMARALKHAWEECELVHSDIKPDNIMIAKDGTAKLTDLGLSKHHSETLEGDDKTISGTPQYISPEQVIGDSLDVRSDFYSLGATLFHALTGEHLFKAASIQDMVKMHLSDEARKVHDVNPNVSEKLSNIIDHMLAKYKEDRIQTCDALINALNKAQDSLNKKNDGKVHLVKSKNLATPGRVNSKTQKKSPVPVIIGLVIALGLIVFVGFSMKSKNAEKDVKPIVVDPLLKHTVVSFSFKKGADPTVLYNSIKSGKNLDGKISGATWTKGRKDGLGALEFKDVNDFVSVNIPDVMESFSIAVWLKIHSLNHDYNSIFSSDEFYRKGSVHWQFMKNGQLSTGIYSSLRNNGYDFDYSVTQSDFNKWKYVVMTYDSNNGSIRLYSDGKYVAGKIIHQVSLIQMDKAQIGNWSKGTRNFQGLIGGFEIYNTVLSKEQIKTKYDAEIKAAP